MPKYLVIVESPTKEKTLKKILGEDYLIKSTKGHLRDLPKTALGIDLKNNFQPKYVIIPKQRRTIQELERVSQKKEKIFLATDPDREGEAIAWHVAQILKMGEDKNRVSFNEITERAVRQAMENPREIDSNMVNSQKARRLLDRLVGYKISPVLWKKIGKKLSAGRVQSVALRLICEREEEIKNFVQEEYWLIKALLRKIGEQEEVPPFEAKLYSFDSKKIKIKEEKEASRLSEEIRGQNFYVKKVEKKKEFKNPPPPFTTSTLQQEAYNRLNFSIKKTMMVAQQLYEGITLGEKGSTGLITYMRTDSLRVSEEIKEEAKKYIEENFGKELVGPFNPSSQSKDKTKDKKIQDAHEAIRPTSVFNHPETIKEFLNNDQYKLYRLIWERFLASRMKAACLEKIKVEIEAEKYIFKSSGVKILFKGFMVVYNQDKNQLNILPPLQEGEKLKLVDLKTEQLFTNPPPRYTEASLVKTLERQGIGRPSTYVPIIDTILRRLYVEKVDKKFVPTELGVIVNSFLVKYFSSIINIRFTSQMEAQLDEIESQGKDWVEILKDFYIPFSKSLEEAETAMKYEVAPQHSKEVCEKCGRPMLIKNGRFGKFLACSGFPECQNTKPFIKKVGVKCPEIGCTGEIIEKRTKRGRIFYGCSNYPHCSFMTWNEPVNQKCPSCGSILTKNHRKKGVYYKCSNPKCSYKEFFPQEYKIGVDS